MAIFVNLVGLNLLLFFPSLITPLASSVNIHIMPQFW